MRDAELDYDFDEEAEGFGRPEPPRPSAEARGAEETSGGGALLARIGLVFVAVALVSLAVQVAGGGWSGLENGTWPGLLSGLCLLSVAGAFTLWARLHGTLPGIRHDGTYFHRLLNRSLPGWIAGVLMTGLFVVIYFEPRWLGYAPETGEHSGLVLHVAPLARALGVGTSQWFLYGVLYTLAICVFGVRMFMKYRHSRYQQVRTASVMLFQLAFAWYLPQLLVYFQKPYVEFNGIWPLKYDYLWPEKASGQFLGAGALGTFLLVFAIGGVIATPILTYFFGKRWYCSWVCGCGGLAETLGDPWRQLSSKSTGAWKLERWLVHGVLVLVVLTTVLLWIDYATSGSLYGSWSGPMRQAYGFYIGAIFSGVIGVGFYPLLGSRVWCRFGCPQAAILGIFQRAFSRFRITTNGGQCMSCGNCSTYCEMGIDVRAYAQRGENVIRASCVGCGVCSAVCPRGVLKLEHGEPGNRFDGAEDPLRAFRESFREPEIYGYRAWSGERGDSAQ